MQPDANRNKHTPIYETDMLLDSVEQHKAMQAGSLPFNTNQERQEAQQAISDAAGIPVQDFISLVVRAVLLTAVIVFFAGIPLLSLRGLAIIGGVALLVIGRVWWSATRSRPTYYWVNTFSAPRWDAPLHAQSKLAQDRKGRYHLDDVPVARTDTTDGWTILAPASGPVTYVRTDVVRQAINLSKPV